MSCKEKDCSFVSNCPEMLEFHAKTSHCSSSNIDTLAKEQENSEPKIKLVKVSSPESNSGSGHIDTGEDSVLVSQPVTLKRKCDEAEAAASLSKKLKQSPRKKPRNLKINVVNVLKSIQADKYFLDLASNLVFRDNTNSWTPAYDYDGKFDVKSSVLKTLIENHVVGESGKYSRDILNQDKILKCANGERFKFLENMEVSIPWKNVTKLPPVQKPQMSKENSYSVAKGYRIIDTNLMSLALKTAQSCGHGTLLLAENNSSLTRTDLASQLGFICSTCGAQTMFTTSSFSVEEPSNYTINKLLISRLGISSYSTLVNELKVSGTAEARKDIKFKTAQQILPNPKIFLSYDERSFMVQRSWSKGPRRIPIPWRPKVPKTKEAQKNEKENNSVDDPLRIEPSENSITVQNKIYGKQKEKNPLSSTLTRSDSTDLDKDLVNSFDTAIEENESINSATRLIDDGCEKGKNSEVMKVESLTAYDMAGITEDDIEVKNEKIPLEDDQVEKRIQSFLEKENKSILTNQDKLTAISSTEQEESNDSIDKLLEDEVSDITKKQVAPKENQTIKLRSFQDLQGDGDDIEELPSHSEQPSHSWTIAEERTQALTSQDIAPGTPALEGVVTPIAPGTKVVSSKVIKTTCTESNLPQGVYRYNLNDSGKEAVLVVKQWQDWAQTDPARKLISSRTNASASAKVPEALTTHQFGHNITKQTSGGSNFSSPQDLLKHYNYNIKEPTTKERTSLSKNAQQELKFDDDNLPAGWTREIMKNPTSKYHSVQIITPDWKKITCRSALVQYIEDNNLSHIDPYSISFSPYKEMDTEERLEILSSKKLYETEAPTYKVKLSVFLEKYSTQICKKDGDDYIKIPLINPVGSVEKMFVPLVKSQRNGPCHQICIPQGHTIPKAKDMDRKSVKEMEPIYRKSNKNFVKKTLVDPSQTVVELYVKLITGNSGQTLVQVPVGHELCSITAPSDNAEEAPSNEKSLFEDYDEEVLIDDGDVEWR